MAGSFALPSFDWKGIFKAGRKIEASAGFLSATSNVTDDSPLVATIGAQPRANEHWRVGFIVASGIWSTRPILSMTGWEPISGLFLVQQGTPLETLAQAQEVGLGFNPNARGIVIPSILQVVPLPSGSFAFSFTAAPASGPLIVPEQFTLRAIVNCAPGTATPGPGAGSFMNLTAQVSSLENA